MSKEPQQKDRIDAPELAEPQHAVETVRPAGFVRRRWPDLLAGLILGGLCLGIVGWMAVHLVNTDQIDARRVGMATPIEVLPAKVGPLHMTIGASGTVSALSTISITARVSSKVTSVPVDLGDVVRKGDLLTQLDDRVFVAGKESARVASDHADKQLERMQTLEDRGYGAAADTETAREVAAAARQVVVQSEIDLGNTKITAPVGSVILTRTVNPGEVSNLGEEVLELGPIEQVYMVAEVPTDKMGFVTIGMEAEVSIDSFPGEVFKGTVVKMDAVASVTTRTYPVYIRIDNPGLRLRPGVTGYARLARTHNALAVPSVAILNPVGDAATVFVFDGQNKAHIRQIRPGIMADGMTEILDGLEEGEKVVTVGQLELHEGDRVAINRSGPWNR
jgi:membrane fusion protein (multidrug efflux system)